MLALPSALQKQLGMALLHPNALTEQLQANDPQMCGALPRTTQ